VFFFDQKTEKKFKQIDVVNLDICVIISTESEIIIG